MKAPMKLVFSNLDAQREAGGKLIAILTWTMIPVVLGARLAAHGALLGLAIASILAAAGATLAWLKGGKGSAGR